MISPSTKDKLTDAVKLLIDINDDRTPYLYICLIIITFIILCLFIWIYRTLSIKNSMCNKLDKLYENNNFSTVSFKTSGRADSVKVTHNDNTTNYFESSGNINGETDNICILKNYYIKTAYNCCCGDGYKNNFVNECALLKCIKLGARCLDFEIYSYNGEPIVAASTANKNSIKETFNYLEFKRVLEVLKDECFDTNTGCANDPMFLHFRIMSENKIMYDKMGDYIKEILDDAGMLLPDNYKHINNINNHKLLSTYVANSELHKKFIIMVNTLHSSTLETSKLYSYVDIKSGSNNMRLLRYDTLIAIGTNNPILEDDVKKSFVMVLPNINNKKDNYDSILPISCGCQFIGMKFQNLDENLFSYYKRFKDQGGYSFILKPFSLRRDLIQAEPQASGESQLPISDPDLTQIPN